ncbi:MAG: transposase [Candidatus Nezhaarchaeales archaeon]
MTPDPYLTLLFKEVFAKYGHVGVAPCRDNKGYYKWKLLVLLPLGSFQYLLERRTLTPIDNDVKLRGAFSIAIDAEGSVYACNHKGRTTVFAVVIYNEKVYVVEALYKALKRRYKVKLYTTNSLQNYLSLLLFFAGFRELSDGEWELIRSFLPPKARTGRPRVDDRRVLNGILYVLITVGGWICLLGMGITQRPLGGLRGGWSLAYGSEYSTH